MSKNFPEDLKLGEEIEQYILKELSKEHPTLGKVQGYNTVCDLQDLDGYSVEIKFDRGSEKTGNIAFEYRYKRLPSGISRSSAIDWVQVYFSKGWVYSQVRTTSLRVYLKSNIKYFKRIKGGDDNQSELIIVPIPIFEESFCSKRIADIK